MFDPLSEINKSKDNMLELISCLEYRVTRWNLSINVKCILRVEDEVTQGIYKMEIERKTKFIYKCR